MLMEKNYNVQLLELLNLRSSSVTFLARIEKINLKKKISLSEFEVLAGDDEFFDQLIAFDSNGYGYSEFYQRVVCDGGVPHLRSLAIKMVAEELFDSELIKRSENENLDGFKTSSIRLANFLKYFSKDLGESEDDAYLSGLFFNLPMLAKIISADPSHKLADDIPDNMGESLGINLSEMGFSSFITTMVSDALKDFDLVSFPLAQSLARIGSEAFRIIGKQGRQSLTDWFPNREMLDIIGMRRRKIFEIIKQQITKY